MSTSSDHSAAANELFEQAAKLFSTAFEAGIKIQEESIRSLSGMLENYGTQEWKKRAEAVVQHTMATAQQSTDEAIRVMNENANTSLNMLEKAFEAWRGESESGPEPHAREMWETAVGSLRKNTEVMVQANKRVLQSWSELAKIMKGEMNGSD